MIRKIILPQRVHWLLTLLSPAVLTTPAIAQDAAIEEIVVTAQKREQSAQSVGITMSAFSDEIFRLHSIQELSEVPELVPNVELFEDYGGGLPTWVIRGVGLQDFNANNTPTAAVYIDENYQTSTAMGSVGLFDIERVEVLKGPQGGLYGRNTSGGAVNVVTRDPQFNLPEGYLEFAYGSWDLLEFEGASSFTLNDNAALRLAARHRQSSDGWQTSLTDDSIHGGKDRSDFRATLLYVPTPDLDVRMKLYGGVDDSELQLGRSIGLYDSTGMLCNALRQGYRDEDSCIDWGSVNRIAGGEEPFDISSQADNAETVLSDPINRHANDYVGGNIRIDVNLGAATLTGITAYDRYDYSVLLDLDGTSGEFGHRDSSSDIEVWNQEIRLSSNQGESFQWLVGASASNDLFIENRTFLLRDNGLVGLGQGILDYRQFTQSRAVYAQVDFNFEERWQLSGDFRYSDISKKYRDGLFRVPTLPPPSDVFVSGLSSDYELDDHISGKIGIGWTPRDDLLVYGSISRGFKAGGFYGGFPFSPAEVDPYEEENVIAYEAGFKSSIADRSMTLNGAVFFYDYMEVQGFISQENPTTGTTIDVLANQGDAEHQGAELQLDWNISESFYLLANAGYLDARLTDSDRVTTNIEGSAVSPLGQRSYAPRWNGNLAAGFRQMVGAGWELNGLLGYNFRSEFSGHASSPADRALNHLPGYGVANARLEVARQPSGWRLSLWVDNIGDREYRTRVKSDGLGSFMDILGVPRSWGLSIAYHW